MTNSRRKGKNSELEVALILYDQLGVRVKRNLEQSRNGGHDLVVVDPHASEVDRSLDEFAIEVKRHSRITDGMIDGFWSQAIQQAEDARKIPALIFRQDRMAWRVMIPMNELVEYGHHFTVELSMTAFCAHVRERDLSTDRRRK